MVKRHGIVVALLVALTAGAACADEEFDKLRDEYDKATAALGEKIKQLTAESRPVEAADLPNPARDFYPRFRSYAAAHADTPAGLLALTWLIDNSDWMTREEERQTELRWIVDRLRTDHAADPAIRDALQALGWLDGVAGREVVAPLCERVLQTNKDVEVRAVAALNFAKLDYRVELHHSADGTKLEIVGDVPRARELFARVVHDYAGTDAARRAAGYIFELDHLQIGMRAPDLAGTDADGKEIKLADCSRRVVVVSFWGSW
jgi:hypothetical protein